MDRHAFIWLAGALCALALHGARPIVSDVTVAQDPVTRKVTIGYTLSEAPGIITFDVLTNGVPVPARHVQNYAGQVARVVNPGTGRRIQWQPEPAWRGQELAPGAMEVRVRAWATNDPPDYVVLNLRMRSSAPLWYTCAEALPAGGLTNDLYRTARLVMRRIHAAGRSFTMGSHVAEHMREVGKEDPHRVSFTNDYYLGVFEVTQGQWARVMGSRWPCVFSNATDWATRPVENLDITNVRRGNWPTLPTPKTDSSDNFVSHLINDTGIKGLELPTEAQWEFACRAGTDTMYNSGFDSASQYRSDKLALLARYLNGGYYVNGVEGAKPDGDTPAAIGGTARVGSYLPNAWGLYDMHGNVSEWCRDWYQQAFVAQEIEPTGPVSGEKRTVRGGSYLSQASFCRSARRKKGNDVIPESGFRLCMLLNR